jgi:copper chaperone CopZ
MRTALLLAVGAVVFLGTPERTDAQLVRVKETIYGMDCAPCAYGVERRLKRMDGVTGVTLSLNEGFADVAFADRNAVTLETIRTAIRQSGFSGEGATVTVRGAVTRTDGALELRTPAGETFVVQLDQREDLVGTVLEASGRVDKDQDARGRWVLRADEVKPVAGNG